MLRGLCRKAECEEHEAHDIHVSLPYDTSQTEHGKATAVFSADRRHRYWLVRTWDSSKPTVAFLMLNPSTADAFKLDPTVRRCWGYAKEWGYGSLVVVNIFGLRSTDPKMLYGHPDPIGHDNDTFIRHAAETSDMVVSGWGNHGSLNSRGAEVLSMFEDNADISLHALKITKQGNPSHPLYLRGDLIPFPV